MATHWEAVVVTAVAVVSLAGFMVRYWFNAVNKDIMVGRTERAHLAGRVEALMVEHQGIKSDIRGHVEREETLLWPKVDNLMDKFNKIENQMIRIEAGMPNGELKTLLVRFTAMEAMFKETVKRLDRSVDDVFNEQRTHNHESEEWKRRIVRLEDIGGKKQGA